MQSKKDPVGGVMANTMTPQERRAWVEDHSDCPVDPTVLRKPYKTALDFLSDRTFNRPYIREEEDV